MDLFGSKFDLRSLIAKEWVKKKVCFFCFFFECENAPLLTDCDQNVLC